MKIELPRIQFESSDLGAAFSYFTAAWEAQGIRITRDNAESEMGKKHERLWAGIKAEMERHAQKAFEMGVSYGRATVKDHLPIGAVSASNPESSPAAPIA